MTGSPLRPGWARSLGGVVLAAAGLAGATAVLVGIRDDLGLASIVLIYLVIVVAVAVAGGVWPALGAALGSDLLVNFFFVAPFNTFTVESRDNLITVMVYVAVAVTVSLAVNLAARQRAAAARHGVEAALLARITAAPLGEGSLSALLEHIRDTFAMSDVSLIEHGRLVAAAGTPEPDGQPLTIAAGDGVDLVLRGPPLFAPDQRFLARLAAAAARTLQAERLAEQATQARELAEVDRLRAALLTAVGHDLRTPLAGSKAAVTSLRDPELALPQAAREELLATIEESTDQMAALVENLLAMSRLQAGALSVAARPVALDEVVSTAVLHTPDVSVQVPDDLPLAFADPGLLERVVANLVANARRAGPPVLVTGRHTDQLLHLQVVDHGPGVPDADKERMFAPFQRLDDSSSDAGLGLGLAIVRGFTEAMGGKVAASDTPAGGLTMTVTLPAAP
jgi:two-component system sensor histidine kinase KdpD